MSTVGIVSHVGLPRYENVVTHFKKKYRAPRPATRHFLEALERACPNCTTIDIPGDGACMLSSLNATLDFSVSKEDAPKFLAALDQDMVKTYIAVGEISPDDLVNDRKNDLSVAWLDGIAAAYAITIYVLSEKDGDYSVHKSHPQIDGYEGSKHYLLRRDGHFWPLKGSPPNVDLWY